MKKEKIPAPKLSDYNLWGKICLFICTFGFSGLFPFMPGTIGSIIASIISFLLVYLKITDANLIQIDLAIACFFIGWFCSWYLKNQDHRADPGYIVIDEVAAIFLINSITFLYIGNDIDLNNIKYILYIISFNFLAFRFFDIVKPSIIGYFDKTCKNAFGLMFDDILSGFVTIFLTIILVTIFKLFQLF